MLVSFGRFFVFSDISYVVGVIVVGGRETQNRPKKLGRFSVSIGFTQPTIRAAKPDLKNDQNTFFRFTTLCKSTTMTSIIHFSYLLKMSPPQRCHLVEVNKSDHSMIQLYSHCSPLPNTAARFYAHNTLQLVVSYLYHFCSPIHAFRYPILMVPGTYTIDTSAWCLTFIPFVLLAGYISAGRVHRVKRASISKDARCFGGATEQ